MKLSFIEKAEEIVDEVSRCLGEPPLDYPLTFKDLTKFVSEKKLKSVSNLTLRRKLAAKGYVICRTPGAWR